MIDASVVTQWLLHGWHMSRKTGTDTRAGEEQLAAPHLLDAEVVHVLRRHVLTGYMPAQRARAALAVFMAAPIARFAHTHLLPRAFELRDNVTIYDALYIALAEALGSPLLTRDKALAKVPGTRGRIEVIG